MMSHDKIKAAARARMARTGESYQTARLPVIKAHKGTQRRVRMSEAYGDDHQQIADDMAAYIELVRQAVAQITDTRVYAEAIRQTMNQHDQPFV